MQARQQFHGFVAALLVVGCPGKTETETGGTLSSGGALGSGGTASNGATTGVGGTASNGGTTGVGGTTSSSNIDASCGVGNLVQLTQVNILVLLDKAASMGYQNSATADTWDHCADRWNPVVTTLNAFFGQANSSRLYASLSSLPADGDNTTLCNPNSYSGSAALKVALTPLDDAGRKQFQDRLCSCASGAVPPSSTCIVPAGGTPTRPAIQGTIDYMGTVAKNYADTKSIIVFITDGEPSFACQNNAGATQICNSCEDLTNGCLEDTSKCLDHDIEIQRTSAVIQSAPSKSIYVVGVGTNLSDSTLNAWATASGNDPVDLRALDGPAVALALMNSLQTIRSASIKCDFDAPLPPNGDTIDPTRTFVHYTPGSGNGYYLPQTADGTAATCTGDKGWYFDNPKVPKKFNLCGTFCDTLQQDAQGMLQVEYACHHVRIIN